MTVTDEPERSAAGWSNEEWLSALRDDGRRREAAIEQLRGYMLRAILLYLARQRSDLVGIDFGELRQLAEDWAQQALIQLLERLDSFRGDSKFTTWAYRVAINLAAGELRRKHWENVSLDVLVGEELAEPSLAPGLASSTPEVQLTRQQVWQTLRTVIQNELTERQRTVLWETVVHGVPVEVVAEQLGTNRNNVYKILHDARRKLKRELLRREWQTEEILAAFASEGT